MDRPQDFVRSRPVPLPLHTVLKLAIVVVAGFVLLFWVLGLPHLTHPLFKVDGFERASLDRYWLSVDDGGDDTARELLDLGALRVIGYGGSS